MRLIHPRWGTADAEIKPPPPPSFCWESRAFKHSLLKSRVVQNIVLPHASPTIKDLISFFYPFLVRFLFFFPPESSLDTLGQTCNTNSD